MGSGEPVTSFIAGISDQILASLISAMVAFIGFLFVRHQIKITRENNNEERRWKRSEYVRNLISLMVTDPNISLVTRILDWREGPARIPPYFQPLFDHARKDQHSRSDWDHHATAPEFFEIDWQRFISSLAVVRLDKSSDAEWRKPDRIMYRTCFDSFCSFVQGLAEDPRSIGVEPSEYADLGYFCHRVIFPLDAGRDPDPAAAEEMKNFIIDYYNTKTYRIMIVQAHIYAITHKNERSPIELIGGLIKDCIDKENFQKLEYLRSV